MTTRALRRAPNLPVALTLAALLVAVGPARIHAQTNDAEYTAGILEFTTEPFFATPLVDHLPASATVPTPLDVLGHIAGAADVLTYPADIYRYLRAVAEASPRVEVMSIGETEEGREMILVLVSSEENMARLDEYKATMHRLADPRTLSESEAEGLFGTARPFYWATGAMHSGETGSPEMLMEIVYRLAVEETPFIREIRDNLIFMTTPVLEVDGRAKQVDVAMAPRLDPDGSYPSRPLWWGKYVAHDDNRDAIGLSLNLSRNVNRTFQEFLPLVVHDLHESQAHLYVSTGRGPYNAWFDPITIDEWNTIAYEEVREMTAYGVPGVFTHDFYDGWAPNYMFTVANGHNAIGRFYETQGAGDGSTRIIRNNNVQREWHRPNTPLPETVWSIRNNVNLQQSGLLIALHHLAANREDYLRNFYRKGQRSVAKATTEGPAAYVFPASDPRPALQARLLRLLQEQGVEVQRLTRRATIDGVEYGEGSYVIRMDQPYSRMADMLLDTQYYNPNDPSPYDDVGWTLGPLFNVETVRIEDPAILDARMEMAGAVTAPGGVEGARRAQAFLIDYAGEAGLASFRFANPELVIQAAEAAFEADGRSYHAGTFVVPVEGNPDGLETLLGSAGSEYGFTAYGVRQPPEASTHPVSAPRVAVMHSWNSTQQEGWLRIGLDEFGIPYDYISVHEARDIADLRSHWDVIIIGPGAGSPLSLLRGVQGDEPVPWMATDVTPNLGRQDSTDDMRGGLELQGVLHLQRFVENGGTLVTIGSTSELPIQFGLAEGVSVRSTSELWAPGGVFRATIADKASPLAYGYGDELGVYFNRGPVFASGGGGRGYWGGYGGGGAGLEPSTDGSTTARHTGRGDLTSGDIVQGRPRDMGEAGVEAFRAAQDDAEGGQGRGFGGGSSSARIVVRFPSEPTQLLISGGLMGGSELTESPTLIDAPRGEGHIVIFGFNPFWRGETLGAYAMLLNAVLHYDHLDAGS